MSVDGIDIASYQSSTYSTARLSFVMVKATEGGGYTNPRHAAQVAHGRAQQLVVGHYHFARAGDPVAQTEFFLRTAVPAAGEVLCLDWEDSGVTSAWKDAWIRHVQAAAPGHRVILYCNRDFWLNRDRTSFCGDGLWIADPDSPAGHPNITAPWVMHQYSEAGGLDHDVANFPTAPALSAWAAHTITPEVPDMDATQARQLAELHAALIPNKGWDYTHGDNPDVHQTLANAAAAAAGAESGVQTLLKGTPVTLTSDQLKQLAAAVAPLLPKPPSAADIAVELAKRLQS